MTTSLGGRDRAEEGIGGEVEPVRSSSGLHATGSDGTPDWLPTGFRRRTLTCAIVFTVESNRSRIGA